MDAANSKVGLDEGLGFENRIAAWSDTTPEQTLSICHQHVTARRELCFQLRKDGSFKFYPIHTIE